MKNRIKITFLGLIKYALVAYKRDLERNKGNLKILLILLSYRIANIASRHRKVNIFANVYAIPVILMHRFITEWVFGLEIPAATKIGKGLIIDHGYALVINKHSTIGDECRIRHCVTIGCKINKDGTQGPSPIIGDYVDIGTMVSIIGDVHIGNGSRIGAGSVVVKNVPPHTIVVGNPAKAINSLK